MKKTYGEKHHIKPKSLFPELTKDKDNIVKLTYKEHYVCHHLLYKMYEELNDKNAMHKMACAWSMMCKNRDGFHVNQYQYEAAKTTMATLKRGIHPSEETRKKMGTSLKGDKNPFFGKHHSEETKKKLHDKLSGDKSVNYGKHPSEETRKKISEANKGKTPWKGKHHSEETKKKISEGNKGKKISEESIKKMVEKIKGCHWWNNGNISTLAKECPGNGFIRGRLP